MGLFGSIAGGALKIGGSIFGGIKASKAIKKAKENIGAQMKENQNWYDRRYNEDSTQRADSQRILNMTMENIRNRNRQVEGRQAVMGGTDESVAAAKEANNQMMADTMGQIAVANEARKDNIDQQYMANKASLNDQLNNLEQRKADAIRQAVNGVADTAGNLGGLF
ncbi:hypothetical protein EVA_08355 [gut metagenome]|uniref:Uncharacterized protein n=1 Tax=gut metagenome TaxID=749906 RepID=J9GTC2_9ZZZZ